MARGRKSTYNEQIATELLSAIATTNKGLIAICKSNPKFPSPPTVYMWMGEREDFLKRYAQAKEDQSQVLEDEMLSIADEEVETVTIPGKNGEFKAKDRAALEHRKLRIDTRKWLMAKLKPKKYGDKIQHTDASGEGPAVFVVKSILDKE